MASQATRIGRRALLARLPRRAFSTSTSAPVFEHHHVRDKKLREVYFPPVAMREHGRSRADDTAAGSLSTGAS